MDERRMRKTWTTKIFENVDLCLKTDSLEIANSLAEMCVRRGLSYQLGRLNDICNFIEYKVDYINGRPRALRRLLRDARSRYNAWSRINVRHIRRPHPGYEICCDKICRKK